MLYVEKYVSFRFIRRISKSLSCFCYVSMGMIILIDCDHQQEGKCLNCEIEQRKKFILWHDEKIRKHKESLFYLEKRKEREDKKRN